MLPVVERAPLHLARVPAPAHQQRRPLRVRPPTPLTPVPLHPDRLPPAQEPRPPGVAPPLARQRLAAVRTPTPPPAGPAGQLPQPLEKCSPALYDVHGLWTSGVSRVPLWSQSPSLLSPLSTRFTNRVQNRVALGTGSSALHVHQVVSLGCMAGACKQVRWTTSGRFETI